MALARSTEAITRQSNPRYWLLGNLRCCRSASWSSDGQDYEHLAVEAPYLNRPIAGPTIRALVRVGCRLHDTTVRWRRRVRFLLLLVSSSAACVAFAVASA